MKYSVKKKLSLAVLAGAVVFPLAIPSGVNAVTPVINFYANVNGQNVAMPDKQIVTKDSKLKLYFDASSHMTVEYAGYLVRGGISDDLKIRGAFTGGVEGSFIGIDLSDTTVQYKGSPTTFQKGDAIIFKFRVVSSDGNVVTREMKTLIGDATSSLSTLDTITVN